MRLLRTRPRAFAAACAATATLVATVIGARADPPVPVFSAPIKLSGAAGGTEPRLAIGPDGRRWVVTNASNGGTAIVYGSTDGTTWTKTAGVPAGQRMATIDVDIVATPSGRLIATELDTTGVSLRVSYSDDDGKTWTLSLGSTLADQDRQWLAVGKDDPVTGLPRVYLVYHNLATGFAAHNMWVQTSTDDGATFGPPIPVTLPGSDAYLDLQCANAGGPDSFHVDPRDGRIYLLWGARTTPPGGGCEASITTPQFNIIASNRLWLATSADGSAGSWTTHLVVDRATENRVVTMQQADMAIDREGNIYVLYPEAPNPYPDFSKAPLMMRWAPPDSLDSWSTPRALIDGGQVGNVLPNIAAGMPGKLNLMWYRGEIAPSGKPYWYTTFARVTGALGDTPDVWTQRVSEKPAYGGTAAELMGTCDTGPGGGIKSGLLCSRATDVWGVALDHDCNFIAAWPSVTNGGGGREATFISTQTDGPTICS